MNARKRDSRDPRAGLRDSSAYVGLGKRLGKMNARKRDSRDPRAGLRARNWPTVGDGPERKRGIEGRRQEFGRQSALATNAAAKHPGAQSSPKPELAEQLQLIGVGRPTTRTSAEGRRSSRLVDVGVPLNRVAGRLDKGGVRSKHRSNPSRLSDGVTNFHGSGAQRAF